MKNLSGRVTTWLARKVSGLMSASPANVRWGGKFNGLINQYPGASAAYSLRKLAPGPVIRLRRGSDSAERDFTAAELNGSVTGAELIAEPNFASSTGWGVNTGGGWVISGGTATLTSTAGNDFLSSDNVADHDYYLMTITIDSCSDFGEVGLRIASSNYRPFSDFGITTAGTYTFMVDRAYNGTTALARFFEQGDAGISCVLSYCSLRPYTPSAAERWAMNVTSAFYPWDVNGDFDATATVWYDQSGNGLNAVQPTLASQPTLITAGVMNTDADSGLPALKFSDADETFLETALLSSPIPQPLTQFAAARLSSSSATHVIGSASVSTARCHMSYSNSSGMFAMYGGASLTSDIPGNLNNHVYGGLFNGDDSKFSLDGPVIAQGDAGDYDMANKLVVGAQQSGTTTNWDGNIQEWIVYPDNQSANRIGIESNIADGWSIPYPTQPLVSEAMPEPAGAYSLRSLTGEASTNVVRLRRGSDSTERDFTEGELTGSVEGSELLTNGDFATNDLTSWSSTFGAALSAATGAAVCDGSQGGLGTLRQDVLSGAIGTVFKISFTLSACSNTNESGMLINTGGTSRFNSLQISVGSNSFLVELEQVNNTFGFYAGSGVSFTIDDVSVVEYTPTSAEQWLLDNAANRYLRQNTDSATATTWYDQSASNQQAIEDPNIQDVNAWTSSTGATEINVGSLVLEKVDTASQVIRSEEVIPRSTYKVEIDYANTSTVSNGFRCYVGTSTDAMFLPSGSGTISQIYTATSSNQFIVQSLNSASIGDELTITRISFIDIGNPATQTTLDAQPKLITAGVTELDNGKPALVFDGVDDVLDIPIVPTDLTLSVFNVLSPSSATNDDMAIQFLKDSSNIMTMGVGGLGSNAEFGLRLYEGAANTDTSGIASSASQTLLTGVTVAATSAQIYANGVAGGLSSSSRIDSSGQSSISSNSSRLWEGTFQELIAYPSDQSVNRTIIETNINAHYSIYYGDDWNDFNNWSDTQTWED